MNEKEDFMLQKELDKERMVKFKAQAEKQRSIIKTMKINQDELFAKDEEPMPEVVQQQEIKGSLNEENLSKLTPSEKPNSIKSSKKSKKSSKPAWAMSEKQNEEAKDDEIDDLLEFAYDLDYDKYMEDFEIRQVFSIIKDRVKEIRRIRTGRRILPTNGTKLPKWSQSKKLLKPKVYIHTVSFFFVVLSLLESGVSKASYKSRVSKAKDIKEKQQADWDRSTTTSKKDKASHSLEEKVAAQIASEMLKDNSKLRGVHSNQSIKKLIEKEAKR